MGKIGKILMGNIGAHLFPTTIAFIFALEFVRSPSLSSFLAYVAATILGGAVYAALIMFNDNRTLFAVRRAMRNLGIADVEIESHEDLLPAPAVNYVNRFLRRSKQMTLCLFVNSNDVTIGGPRAYEFNRYCSLCIHSLGAFGEQPKKNMILFHEFGHLLHHQPRSSFLGLVFGNAIPLLFLIYDRGVFTYEIQLALVWFFSVEIVMLAFVDKYSREVYADNFALACWFTEQHMEWSNGDIEKAHRRGHFFETMPFVLCAYEKYVLSASALRRRAFRRAYKRMNQVGWLNRVFYEADIRSGGVDLYCKEVFFRRTFFAVLLSVRSLFLLLKAGAVVYFFLQFPAVEMNGYIALVLLCCALAMLFLYLVSFFFLGDEAVSYLYFFRHRRINEQDPTWELLPMMIVEEIATENENAKHRDISWK